ncbi:BMP family ABC transporter substrate-binding protein [Haloarcula sp. S1CR25-12]|uniref:BMP family ABC transporter substrate-binding protein n=1 Tax=Haloarcula saliterrae TaxID=2950534 RepID=A0ABU2FFS3_9EURY|nr:BMP family ABC transporter substrate-binding protein [Haloarcula sp. S1CR25-12]MDS0261122.1 BMP family ABC transporter substrate-binding protein [Haloarcula sp. S1CR25-12]
MVRKQLTRRDALKAATTTGLIGLAGCSGGSSSGDSDGVSAAFIYQAEVSDVGWDRAHEDARQAVTDQYDWLETEFSEAVAPGDVQRVIEQYISSGMDAIFGTTFGYMDPMHEIAPEYPDVVFEHCSGFKTRENMGRYYGRLYQARFLCGVAAGLLTETNQLGYVGAFPIPELVRQINAFVRGARLVNPDVTASVRWTNAWLDPPAVTQAVNALVNDGADVINNHQTSTAAVQTAADNEAYAFTYTTSMADAGGDWYGSSALFNWEEFYGPTLEAINNGNWESEAYWNGLDAGVVGVDDFGPQVPDDVVSEVETYEEEIVSGDRTVWQGTKFEGESDEFLFGEMSSYVEGIEGEVPNS